MTSILKVDTIQDTAGNNIINENADTITIGASGDTITIPSGATISNLGTATGFGANTPAFLAYISADQSIPDATATKAQFNTEVFDVGSCYDNSTNYRFTPTTSGKYMIFSNLAFQLNDYGIYNASIEIYKNGSQYAFANNVFGTGASLISSAYISQIIEFNGSSDYVEIFGYLERHTSSGNKFGINHHILVHIHGKLIN
jgi:hypothetical protein